MYCSNCGSILSEDARFCGRCGRPVVEHVETSPAPAAPAPAPAPAPVYVNRQSKNTAAIVISVIAVLFGSVFILGIIAAIAIPNLINAVDRGKQKRTMADLRSIGTAIESYAVDTNEYPQAASIDDLRAALQPKYMKDVPTLDGWGHAFVVDAHKDAYRISSTGKDGVADGCLGGATNDFRADICFQKGEFIQYPERAR